MSLFTSKYYKKLATGEISSSIARWSFNLGNSLTAIKLSDEKIAPGSNGEFEIEVDATGSEVDVEYMVKVVEEKNIPTNMKFFAEINDEKGGVITKTEEYSSFLKLADENLFGKILVDANNQKRIIKVYWNWPLNENEEPSTDNESATLKLDEQGNSSLDCSIKLEIIGKQSS
jgi:hypothetical protein